MSYRPHIVSTAKLSGTTLARQVASIPDDLAALGRRAGADEPYFAGSHLDRPLRAVAAAGAALAEEFAAVVAFVERAEGQPPKAHSLRNRAEAYSMARLDFENAMELWASRDCAQSLDAAAYLLSRGRAERRPVAGGGVAVFATEPAAMASGPKRKDSHAT